MHPLTSGAAIATLFQNQVTIPDFPNGACPSTLDDLRAWLETMQIQTSANKSLFGYTAGTIESASVEDRDWPRIVFDDQGRYVGVALWMPEMQGWSIPGQIGQYMTLRRVKDTLVKDIAGRPLAGWRLCDGTTVGLPNLTSNTVLNTMSLASTPVANGTVSIPSPWFSGTSPNYDTYTLGYVGV